MLDKITKRTVDALKIDEEKSESVLWDTELKGFGCRVQRGGSKSYILHYRAGRGRGAPIKKVTIGRHGSPWTPDTARSEAKQILGRVAAGADPASERAAQKVAPTISELAERFFTEHAEAKRKASTTSEYRRLIDKFIIKDLGKRKVVDVTSDDISKLHHKLRKSPYQANRVLAVLSKMFNLAELWGWRSKQSNPCRGIERFEEKHRERFLTAAELARLGDALTAYGGSEYVPAAIKLLVFTGARLGEVLGLRWEWITAGRARLPDRKTGEKTIHLPAPALAVLAGLPRVAGNPHVIVGAKEGGPLVNLEKPWRAIRHQAGLDDVRLHDLRHAFASVAVASGMGLPIIGKMLGHKQAATTSRYAHLDDHPVKAAAAAVAGKIAADMGIAAIEGDGGDPAEGGNVVAIRRRRTPR